MGPLVDTRWRGMFGLDFPCNFRKTLGICRFPAETAMHLRGGPCQWNVNVDDWRGCPRPFLSFHSPFEGRGLPWFPYLKVDDGTEDNCVFRLVWFVSVYGMDSTCLERTWLLPIEFRSHCWLGPCFNPAWHLVGPSRFPSSCSSPLYPFSRTWCGSFLGLDIPIYCPKTVRPVPLQPGLVRVRLEAFSGSIGRWVRMGWHRKGGRKGPQASHPCEVNSRLTVERGAGWEAWAPVLRGSTPSTPGD